MTKRYLFFLRHYNDIDNIVPAIYFFLKDNPRHRADVIIYSEDYDFRNNENLIHMKETFENRFSCKWLGSYFKFNINQHFDILENKGSINKIKNKIRLIVKKIYHIAKKFTKKRIITMHSIITGKADKDLVNEKIKLILKEHQWPSLVCFDTNRSPDVKGLLNALRYNNVKKIICLPVSPLININTLRTSDSVNLRSEFFRVRNDYSGFDALGYVDNNFVNSFNKTFQLLNINSSLKNKTTALGSIRYCPAWLSVRQGTIKPFKRKTNKIKTVFFLSHPKSNVNWEEIERTLAFLSHYSEYEIIVKHHTRDATNITPTKYPGINFLDNIDSSALIDWADVVIFWSTSVAIEGYIKHKTMVCLSYVCGNKNLYELCDAGFVARCRDDLHEFLEIYKTNRNQIRYNKNGIQKLLEEVIIPGGDQVIINYLNFMRKNET